MPVKNFVGVLAVCFASSNTMLIVKKQQQQQQHFSQMYFENMYFHQPIDSQTHTP